MRMYLRGRVARGYTVNVLAIRLLVRGGLTSYTPIRFFAVVSYAG